MLRLEHRLRLLQREYHSPILDVTAGREQYVGEFGKEPLEDRSSRQRRDSPEDVVDADDALWLRVPAVVNDGSLGLHPHVASVLRQHAVLTTDCLTLGTHCRHNENRRVDIKTFLRILRFAVGQLCFKCPLNGPITLSCCAQLF